MAVDADDGVDPSGMTIAQIKAWLVDNDHDGKVRAVTLLLMCRSASLWSLHSSAYTTRLHVTGLGAVKGQREEGRLGGTDAERHVAAHDRACLSCCSTDTAQSNVLA